MGRGAAARKSVQDILPADGEDSDAPGEDILGGGETSMKNLRVHFVHCYVRDTIVFLE